MDKILEQIDLLIKWNEERGTFIEKGVVEDIKKRLLVERVEKEYLIKLVQEIKKEEKFEE